MPIQPSLFHSQRQIRDMPKPKKPLPDLNSQLLGSTILYSEDHPSQSIFRRNHQKIYQTMSPSDLYDL